MANVEGVQLLSFSELWALDEDLLIEVISVVSDEDVDVLCDDENVKTLIDDGTWEMALEKAEAVLVGGESSHFVISLPIGGIQSVQIVELAI